MALFAFTKVFYGYITRKIIPAGYGWHTLSARVGVAPHFIALQLLELGS